jgi:hypothetical protein
MQNQRSRPIEKLINSNDEQESRRTWNLQLAHYVKYKNRKEKEKKESWKRLL